jgi:hypothetical protein
MTISLEKLLEVGRIDDGYETREVSWQNGDDTYQFQIQVKKELTAADSEAIANAFEKAGGDDSETSVLATRVSRTVMMDGKRISFNQAASLKWGLLVAIAVAASGVEKPAAPKD